MPKLDINNRGGQRPTTDGPTPGDKSGRGLDNSAAGDAAASGNGGKPLSRAQKFQQENDARIAAAEKAARDKREAASNPQPATNGEDLSGAHASLGIARNRSDARDINSHKVRVTFFDDEFAKTFTTQELTLPALCNLILKTKAKTKTKLPWLKFARFGNKTDPDKDTGNLRWNGNVEAIDGSELDYDQGIMSFEEAVAALTAMGLRGIVYTSPSSTKAKPRWRYLLPTSRKLPPETRAKLVARVHGRLGNIFGNESFTLSQSYYYGRAEDNTAADHKAVVLDGKFIDMADELYKFQEKGLQKKSATPAAPSSTQGPRGFEARMALLGDGEGLGGFNKVLIPAIAAYAAAHGSDFDEGELKEIIKAAVNDAPKSPQRKGKEIERCLSDKHLDRLITSAKEKYGKNAHLGFDLADNNLPICNSQKNIRIALTHLNIEVCHDSFQSRSIIKGLDKFDLIDDPAMDRLWLTIDEKYRFRPTKDFFWTVVNNEARLNSFHPVCDYLNALTWDGTKRLDTWLIEYAGAADSKYVRAVSPLPLIAAVRRVRRPGCKFDEMLTLISDQGFDKSTGLAILAVKPDWFSDDLPLNIDSKKTIERLRGRWIIEAAELKGMRQGDVEHLKSFLSRQVDRARMVWDRTTSELLRQCIIIGTTNHLKFLRDHTGNRRFWPVQVVAFDIVKLKRDVDQLWAEAAAREARGDSIRLAREFWDDAADEQIAHTLEEPWLEIIQNLLGDIEGKLLSADAWKLVGIAEAQRTQESNGRLGVAMRLCGWERKKMRFAGISNTAWGYVRVENKIKHLKQIMVDYDWRSRETSVRLSDATDDSESESTKNTSTKNTGGGDDIPF